MLEPFIILMILVVILKQEPANISVSRPQIINLMNTHKNGTLTITKKLGYITYTFNVDGFYFHTTCYVEINIPDGVKTIDLR